MTSLAAKATQNMVSKSLIFLALVFVAYFHFNFCYAEKAPYYSFLQESTSAPQVSFYDYIIIGGGTSGCPLAATLSASANVLVLERGGSPYVNPGNRARVLGGGSVINAGFYSHAEADFLKQAGLNEALVNHSYQWVETKVAFKPPMLQWQSALRNGLLEAGVLPDNGFTHDHVHGTKVGGTIFDTGGHKHTAADLLEYAKSTFHKWSAAAVGWRLGVIFEDATGRKQSAFLTKDSKSEVISSAGTVTDVERCWSRPPTRGGDGPSRGGPRDGC
ncbi:Glucose-methanol-choline (GMC) oxidoreductase family protein, putative [Theobroma cacao]|uniref:Glucose-methanol-choline (GMC) oxidoreductase family protein, putative n=1 Tax=Theobroma cacao TaxID=3641 RepID=A0A061G0G8_THECC|nr:Glucose-methanol-choline (GMC) oxidoreductase family protein, putative [Theobroma cacao]